MSILSGFRLWLPAAFARGGCFRWDSCVDSRVIEIRVPSTKCFNDIPALYRYLLSPIHSNTFRIIDNTAQRQLPAADCECLPELLIASSIPGLSAVSGQAFLSAGGTGLPCLAESDAGGSAPVRACACQAGENQPGRMRRVLDAPNGQARMRDARFPSARIIGSMPAGRQRRSGTTGRPASMIPCGN